MLAKDIKVTRSSHRSPPGTCYQPACFQGGQPRVWAGAAGGGPGRHARARPPGSHFLLPAPSPAKDGRRGGPGRTTAAGPEAALGRRIRVRDPAQSLPAREARPSPALPTFPAPKAKVSQAHKPDSGSDVRGTWRRPQPVTPPREATPANGHSAGAGFPPPKFD